jgi:hypothetical protein
VAAGLSVVWSASLRNVQGTLPLNSSCSDAEQEGAQPQALLHVGLEVARLVQFFVQPADAERGRIGVERVLRTAGAMASTAASAASMPLLIGACCP